ncbi:unnamed protein product [Parajaminaea phylloscopi]
MAPLTSSPKRPPLLTISCSFVSWAHTVLGFSAFFGALVLALSLHYKRVVQNGVAGWPDEWWPSVSATIGDWPQERSLLQIFIALMSGPRLALVLLSSLLVSLSSPNSPRARWLGVTGTLRTLACGGWVYCTSTNFPMVHDVSMITYLLLTPAWMFISWGSLAPQPSKEALAGPQKTSSLTERARKSRRNTAFAFFASIPFMCIFYYRHKVLLIPGAYTTYSFFEWNLIIQDLLFDFWSLFDLSRLEIHIVEAPRPSTSIKIDGSWWQGGTARAVREGAWSTKPAEVRESASSKAKSDAREVDNLLETDTERDKGHNTDRAEHSVLTLVRHGLGLTSDVYLAFLWWTTLTALHPTIFFFSVYNLSIGGHEILLVVQVFALAFVLVPPVRKLIMGDHLMLRKVAPTWRSLLLLVSLLSIGTWWVRDPLTRLILTGVANGASAILHTVTWGEAWQQGPLAVQRSVVVWLCGLLLSCLSKYACHSNNPLWPFMKASNGGQHPIGLTLAACCIIESLCRPKVIETVPRPRLRTSQSKLSEASAALGMGSLLFALHTFLTDSGTMIAWTWTGYPIKGPMAVSHGWIVIAAAALGIAVAIKRPHLGGSPEILIALASSNAILLLGSNWLGFVGAIGTAFALPLTVVQIAERTLKHHPFRVMLWSWLVADLLTFFQVLTVAYAFVPGGKPFRERTWAMLLAQNLFLAIALGSKYKTPSEKVAPAFPTLPPLTRRVIFGLLGALSAVAFVIARLRTIDTSTIRPYHHGDGSRVFNAGIQTVHFGLDQPFYDSSRRMANLYRDMRLDVIGLLETDLHRSVFGNRDLTQWIAEDLGMYADIGPKPTDHTWGCVLFSKFPIINSTHHLLPSPHGELAPAIHAVLDVFGEPVNVWVSHNGQEEDPLDRELQTKAIAKVASETYPQPFVFLGYLVTTPHAPRPNPYRILFEDGRIHDVESVDMDRWCQYIGFRSVSRVAYVRVSRFDLTDTELQIASFRVADVKNGESPVDPDRDDRPRLGTEADVPAIWHFPPEYYDPPALVYQRHKYSPYPTPRYYLPL